MARENLYFLSSFQQVGVQPRPFAVNTALLAFAAERRAAAPCYRSPVAGDRAVSKPLLRCCNPGQTVRETDRRTDTAPLHRPGSAHIPCGQCKKSIGECFRLLVGRSGGGPQIVDCPSLVVGAGLVIAVGGPTSPGLGRHSVAPWVAFRSRPICVVNEHAILRRPGDHHHHRRRSSTSSPASPPRLTQPALTAAGHSNGFDFPEAPIKLSPSWACAGASTRHLFRRRLRPVAALDSFVRLQINRPRDFGSYLYVGHIW